MGSDTSGPSRFSIHELRVQTRFICKMGARTTILQDCGAEKREYRPIAQSSPSHVGVQNNEPLLSYLKMGGWAVGIAWPLGR